MSKMLFVHKIGSKHSYEILWIYDRADDGLFIKIQNAKKAFGIGDKISIENYTPKLEKQITTNITAVETNQLNENICITVRNQKDIAHFRKLLVEANSSVSGNPSEE